MIRNDKELKEALESHGEEMLTWGMPYEVSAFENVAVRLLEKRIEMVREHWREVREYTERKKELRKKLEGVK